MMTCKDWIELLFSCATTLVAVTGSILAVVITYHKTKKIKFYETYLEKKSHAYEGFIKATSVDNYDEAIHKDITEKLIVARLYSNKTVCDILGEFATAIPFYYSYKPTLDAIEQSTGSTKEREMIEDMVVKYRKIAVMAMYEDIENCRNFKFNLPPSNELLRARDDLREEK